MGSSTKPGSSTVLYTARWVLPIAAAAIEQGAVLTEGSTIREVGPERDLVTALDVPSAVRRVDLGECVLMPGLVNVHTHLELSILRGWFEEPEFFSWIRQLTEVKYGKLSREDFELSARWGVVEAIRAGVTTVGDASDQGVVLDALIESGLAGIAYQEVFGPDPIDCDIRTADLGDRLAELLHRQTARVRVGVSPHAPYTVSKPLFERTSDIARQHKLPISLHIAESRAEVELIRSGRGPFADFLRGRGIAVKAHSCSPIEYLANTGILTERPLLVHAVQLDSDDLDRLQNCDARIAHCPKSNAKLAHGVAPLTEMLTRGLRTGLGSDGTVSNNSCDLIDEARFACLQQRARGDLGPAKKLSAIDLVRLMTLGGAEALGVENEIGTLEAGKRADLIAVDLSGSRHQPVIEPETALAFTASGGDVVLTVVDGQVLYTDGKVQTLDEVELARQVVATTKRLREK